MEKQNNTVSAKPTVFDVSKLQPCKIKTEDFLNNFKSPFIGFVFNKDTKCGDNKTIPYTKHNLDYALDMNKNNNWCVYFTPNGELGRESNTGGRHNDAGLGYDYMVFDIDNVDLDTQHKLANNLIGYIKFLTESSPNFIVKTYGGYHIYYKLKEKYTPDKYSEDNKYHDIYLMIQEKLGKGAIDQACKDISRLFRLPNTFYRKKINIGGEFFVNILHYEEKNILDFHLLYDNARFDIGEVRKNNELKVKIQKRMPSIDKKMFIEDFINDIEANIGIEEVLSELGYQFKGTMILEDGRTTNGWKINKAGNYVNNFASSSKGARPEGGPFWFAYNHFKKRFNETCLFFQKVYGKDYSRVYTNIVDIDLSTENVKDIFGDSVDKEAISVYEDGLGTLIFDANEKNMLWDRGEGDSQVVSNFVIKLLGTVMINGKRKIIIQLISNTDESRAMFMPDSSGASAFNTIIKREGAYTLFVTGDKIMSLITFWISKRLPKLKQYKLTDEGGFTENGDFIAGNQLYSKQNKIIEIDKKTGIIGDSIVHFGADDEKALESRIGRIDERIGFNLEYNPDITESTIEKLICQLLPSIYNPQKILPLFLGMCNTLMATFYKRLKKPCHHILLWGEVGAGKTKTIEICKRLLGFKNLSGIDASGTMFPIYMSCVTGFPTHLAEFNPDAHNLGLLKGAFKNIYDGQPIERGKPDQTISRFGGKSSFIMDGNYIISDWAVQTRSIVIAMYGADKKSRDDFDSFLFGLHKDYRGLLCKIIELLRKEFFNKGELFSESMQYKKQLLKEYIISQGKDRMLQNSGLDRILENYSQVLNVFTILVPNEAKLKWGVSIIGEAMIEFFENCKGYDTNTQYMGNLIENILGMVVKARGNILENIMSLDYKRKELSIQISGLKTFISNKKDKAEIDQIISMLSSGKMIGVDDFGITLQIKLDNPRLKQYFNSIKMMMNIFKNNGLFNLKDEDIEYLITKQEIEDVF